MIVDCCLGGFFTSMSSHLNDGRFPIIDFRHEKVFAMTCDPHKYGLGPKGCSVVLFKNIQIKLASTFVYSKWSGGIYGTITIAGSRSSAPIIGSWASLKSMGLKGMKKNYIKIIKTLDVIKEGINSIPELDYIGNPMGCAIAFTYSKEFKKSYNIITLNSIIKDTKNWHLSVTNYPPALRISITLNNSDNLRSSLIPDLKFAIQKYKDDKKKYDSVKSTSTVLYGTVLNMPGGLPDKVVGFLISYLNLLE